MDWVNDPRLWVAATPFCVFIGASVAFYFATEAGDTDPVPAVKRGDSSFEPWGVPVALKKYRLPGDSVIRNNRVIEHDTAQFARIKDERN
jgi:hypothetical protein